MSNEKTGGFWDSYRRAMPYKAHFRLLIPHPFMALVVWLLPYIFYGVNPLEHHPYIFYASIMVIMLCIEGDAFLTRKYDLLNKEIPEPFVRKLQYLLSGIMFTATLVNTNLPEHVLSGSEVMRAVFQATFLFIFFTTMYALFLEKRIKKNQVKHID